MTSRAEAGTEVSVDPDGPGVRPVRRRPAGARAAGWWLWTLFGLAAAAPILASEAPLLILREGGIEFPAFRGFGAMDVVWIGAGVSALAAGVIGRWKCRAAGGGRRRWVLVSGLAVLGALTAVAAVLTPRENLGATDWPGLSAGPGVTAVWAPIRHGFSNVDPEAGSRFRPPGEVSGHWLGTDREARDVAARLLFGARAGLLVGFGAVALSTVLGVLLGGVAGFMGGRADAFISWLIQVMMCFPVLITVVALQAMVAPGLGIVVLLLGLVRWTGPARLVRAEVLRLREAEFVLAARALGVPAPRILWRHCLPHAMAPVIVNAAFGVAGGILLESGLSFLGLGAPTPAPSWGETMQEGFGRLSGGTHLVILPGLLLFGTVVACHALGDALRDALDPRLEEVRR